MKEENRLQDTYTITYRWDLDELDERERRDVFEMITDLHENYDNSRSAKTDTEFVVRLDYHS